MGRAVHANGILHVELVPADKITPGTVGRVYTRAEELARCVNIDPGATFHVGTCTGEISVASRATTPGPPRGFAPERERVCEQVACGGELARAMIWHRRFETRVSLRGQPWALSRLLQRALFCKSSSSRTGETDAKGGDGSESSNARARGPNWPHLTNEFAADFSLLDFSGARPGALARPLSRPVHVNCRLGHSRGAFLAKIKLGQGAAQQPVAQFHSRPSVSGTEAASAGPLFDFRLPERPAINGPLCSLLRERKLARANYLKANSQVSERRESKGQICNNYLSTCAGAVEGASRAAGHLAAGRARRVLISFLAEEELRSRSRSRSRCFVARPSIRAADCRARAGQLIYLRARARLSERVGSLVVDSSGPAGRVSVEARFARTNFSARNLVVGSGGGGSFAVGCKSAILQIFEAISGGGRGPSSQTRKLANSNEGRPIVRPWGPPLSLALRTESRRGPPRATSGRDTRDHYLAGQQLFNSFFALTLLTLLSSSSSSSSSSSGRPVAAVLAKFKFICAAEFV
ncbi:Hypothetical predicted protein [Olea europaea subsp. europaea]|uniref:Uncharacterized protein n=1 Tax=Olea europaea subsp. europaea TaxID=158383 RepID=A0A8S0TS66_OLEEU|nr:Hypothetical predicted protein [Olea europaea subsp. europaea]